MSVYLSSRWKCKLLEEVYSCIVRNSFIACSARVNKEQTQREGYCVTLLVKHSIASNMKVGRTATHLRYRKSSGTCSSTGCDSITSVY
jgi:hypothetical protein